MVLAVNEKLKQGITISGAKVKDVSGFFKALDADNTRSLAKAEISKGFKRLKISISEKLLEDLVNAGDVDRSRRIESKEFVRLLDPASWTDPDGGPEEERAQSEKVLKEVTGKIKFTLKAGGRTLYGKRVTDARTFYEAVDSDFAVVFARLLHFLSSIRSAVLFLTTSTLPVPILAEETVVVPSRRTNCSRDCNVSV